MIRGWTSTTWSSSPCKNIPINIITTFICPAICQTNTSVSSTSICRGWCSPRIKILRIRIGGNRSTTCTRINISCFYFIITTSRICCCKGYIISTSSSKSYLWILGSGRSSSYIGNRGRTERPRPRSRAIGRSICEGNRLTNAWAYIIGWKSSYGWSSSSWIIMNSYSPCIVILPIIIKTIDNSTSEKPFLILNPYI